MVFFEPPAIGNAINKDMSYAEVKSVKAVSDVISPLSGQVVAINEAVVDRPELINEDPYGAGWLVRIKIGDASELVSLMDAADYQLMLD